MNALGFQIPGSGVELRPIAIITGLLVGTVVTIVSAVVPARQAARVPRSPRCARSRSNGPSASLRRTAVGGAIFVFGLIALLLGLFGSSGISFVGIGALLMLVGVFVLSAAVRPPLASPSAFRSRRCAASSAASRARTRHGTRAGPRTTGAAVMIAVSLVGFITIFAASRERVDRVRHPTSS